MKRIHLVLLIVFGLCFVVTHGSAADAIPPPTSIDFDVADGMVATVTVKFTTTGSLGLGRVEEWTVSPVVFAAHVITDCKKDIRQPNEVFFTGTPIPFNYGPGSYSIYPVSLDACPSTLHRPAYITLISYFSDPAHPANTTAVYSADLGTEQAVITVVMQGIGTGDAREGTRGGKSSGKKPSTGTHHGCCCCGGDWGSLAPTSHGRPETGGPNPDVVGPPMPQEQGDAGTIPAGFFPQEKENWCWAAVSKSTINQIGHIEVEQCTIATEAYSQEPCPNYGFSRVYTDGHLSGQYTSKSDLGLASIKASMGADSRALPWFIEWIDGGARRIGGHFMMIMDASPAPVFAAAGGGTILTVFDPLPVNEGDVFMISTTNLSRPNGSRFQSDAYYAYDPR